jgi:branched-chain amino acid transport system substrate-binding protein
MKSKNRLLTPSTAVLSAVLLTAVAACGSGSSSSGTVSGSGKSFDVGLVVPQTGATVAIGNEIKAGFELGLKAASTDGYTFTGKYADEGTAADAAVQGARSLISEGTKNIAGLISSADCAAVAPVVQQLGGTIVSTTCSGDNLTRPKPVTPSFFTVAAGDTRYDQAFSTMITQKFPKLTKLGVFAWDYPIGHASPPLVQSLLKDQGQTVELKPQVFVPIQATSYRTEISGMASAISSTPKEQQGIILITAGSATTNFLQQAKAFGLADNVAFVGGPSEGYLGLRGLKGAFPNYWYAYDYFYGYNGGAANTTFVADFKAKTGNNPTGFAWQGYAAAAGLAAAMKKAGTDDPAKVQAALTSITFDTPTGSTSFDPTSHRGMSPVIVSNVAGDPTAADGVKTVESFAVPAS